MGKKHEIGHTCITWDEKDVETAVSTLARLGYHGVEVFGWTLERLEREGKLDIFEKSRIPLVSSYFAMNLCDPNQFEESLKVGKHWGRIMERLGAKYVCLGGEDVDRRYFSFMEHRECIVETVNEYGEILGQMGLKVCYHPHTGTPVQAEDEIRFLMENVNPKYVAFAPDVGQLQKAGADPVRLLKEYLPLVAHVHLKDFDGKPLCYTEDGKEEDSSGFSCYTPLGEGVVCLPEILELLENSANFNNLIMVELDGGKRTPIPQEEAVIRNRKYLIKQGYSFQ